MWADLLFHLIFICPQSQVSDPEKIASEVFMEWEISRLWVPESTSQTNFYFGFICFPYRSTWNFLHQPIETPQLPQFSISRSLRIPFEPAHHLFCTEDLYTETLGVGKFLLHFSEGFTNTNLIFIKLLWGRSVLPPSQYDEGTETQMLCLRLVPLWGREDGSRNPVLLILSPGHSHACSFGCWQLLKTI